MESIKGVNVKGKKVIVRVDYNVPFKNGKILDDARIVASLETVEYLAKKGARVILLSHLGRIKCEEDKQINSLSMVAKRLSTLVKHPVYFVPFTRGEEVEKTIENTLNGEIVLLENTRFEDYPNKLESSCDEKLSKYWAKLADMFVLDAFGTAHRCHASTYGISKYIPSYAGFLVEKEVKVLDDVIAKKKNVIMGGAKIEDKIGVIDNLIRNCDHLFIGGAMCFTFLKAKGFDVGSSIVSEDNIGYAINLLNKYNKKIILPVDVMTQNGVKSIDKLEKDDIGYDIGPKTIKMFKDYLSGSKLVLWNGPLGKYEEKEYGKGTKSILTFLKKMEFKSILAGGDILAAAAHFKTELYYMSTGGGSTLEYLEGKRFRTLERLKG